MPTVLVIDDEESIRHVCCEALRTAGFETLSAASGVQALKLMATQPVDLVVTDVVMPDMDGIELIQALRSKFLRIPVIAMSGGGVLSADDCLDFAGKLGAARVLAKPFSLHELVTAAQEAINESKS